MRNADELREYLQNCDKGQRELVDPLIDELIFMENQLEQLKKLPFIKVNPKNAMIQQQTEAFRMYKALIQQYNNSIKTLAVVFNKAAGNEEHPFAAWLKEQRGA